MAPQEPWPHPRWAHSATPGCVCSSVVRLFIFGAGATIGTLGKPGVAGFGKALQQNMRTWR
jgi:hypothetical protein